MKFTYSNPTVIHFGQGKIAAIAKAIDPARKVLVIYGGGSIKANGVYDQVAAALAGRQWREFGGVEPNPTVETLDQAVALIRQEGLDYILAVGGGSVIDGSKYVAAAACYDGDGWDILTGKHRVKQALPLGAVLTLPATGSESNSGAVITRRATHEKLVFSSDAVFPRFAVLDPTTALTLPPRQVANGVVDAFVHVVEQYLTYPVDAKVQDRFAEGLLLTLIEDGPRALAEPDNLDVRANLMWTATLALNGLIGAGVPNDWATHMLGHEITALHGVDHARTLAVVLPAMLQERRAAKREKLLQYAERVWNLRDGDPDARIDAAIERTRAFFERMEIKTRLADYGIGRDAIPALVAQLERHGLTALGERRDLSPEDARKVYERAA